MAYLLNVYNNHFKKQLTKEDIVWNYSGVRPLCDDESDSPQAVTRDYTLEVADVDGKAPLLSVFGGKLTTYRKLAEHAMDKLEHYYPGIGGAWTKNGILPGGQFSGDVDSYKAQLAKQYPWLPESQIYRYAHTYGSRMVELLGSATALTDLGENFGHDFYEQELKYLVDNEWVKELDDAIWRRTKVGMWLSDEQKLRVAQWIKSYRNQ